MGIVRYLGVFADKAEEEICDASRDLLAYVAQSIHHQDEMRCLSAIAVPRRLKVSRFRPGSAVFSARGCSQWTNMGCIPTPFLDVCWEWGSADSGAMSTILFIYFQAPNAPQHLDIVG